MGKGLLYLWKKFAQDTTDICKIWVVLGRFATPAASLQQGMVVHATLLVQCKICFCDICGQPKQRSYLEHPMRRSLQGAGPSLQVVRMHRRCQQQQQKPAGCSALLGWPCSNMRSVLW